MPQMPSCVGGGGAAKSGRSAAGMNVLIVTASARSDPGDGAASIAKTRNLGARKYAMRCAKYDTVAPPETALSQGAQISWFANWMMNNSGTAVAAVESTKAGKKSSQRRASGSSPHQPESRLVILPSWGMLWP